MESRYALREAQCAIGYDCRRLDDGRRAVFRHTKLHKLSRQYCLELEDIKSIMSSSVISSAAISSHGRIDISSAINNVIDCRKKLISISFPYLDIEGNKTSVEDGDYDKYFEKLDEMKKHREEMKKHREERMRRKREAKKSAVKPSNVPVGDGTRK